MGKRIDVGEKVKDAIFYTLPYLSPAEAEIACFFVGEEWCGNVISTMKYVPSHNIFIVSYKYGDLHDKNMTRTLDADSVCSLVLDKLLPKLEYGRTVFLKSVFCSLATS